MAVGAGVLTPLGPGSGSAAKVSYQVILGIGIGPFWSVLNLPLQASMENVDDMGLAAGILCSFRLFGGLIGLGVSSTIFNTIFEDRLRSLGPLAGDLAILGDVRHAVGFIPMLEDAKLPADLIGAVIDVCIQKVCFRSLLDDCHCVRGGILYLNIYQGEVTARPRGLFKLNTRLAVRGVAGSIAAQGFPVTRWSHCTGKESMDRNRGATEARKSF